METLPVTIRIEKHHIMGANMLSTTKCAVANGIGESVPLASKVWVGYDVAFLWPVVGILGNPNVYNVVLPLHVGRFIRRLALCDRLHLRFLRRFFKPFSFELWVREDMVAVEPQRPKATALAPRRVVVH